MKRRRCSQCGELGHYARTCGRPSKTKRPRGRKRVTTSLRGFRARYSSKSNRAFVDALRDFLGLKPMYGGVASSKPSSFEVGDP